MIRNIKNNYLKNAIDVLKIESQAIIDLINDLDELSFNKAVNAILNCKGKTAVIGVGKSGHIANKIASTLSSTGTPAFFIHPAEAAHGDLGMISNNDITLFLSNSGESKEILNLIPSLKRKNIIIITITGNKNSNIASLSDINLFYNIKKEACPLGLAPTTSSTVSLALGDALAICLLDAKKFTKNDFALIHPAGNLGRKLLLTVNDIMHQGNNLPVTTQEDSLKNSIIAISEKRLGFIAIINDHNNPIGIFTDGDLRRLFQKYNNYNMKMKEIMNKNPICIESKKLVTDALNIMKNKKINALLVVNSNNKLIGGLNMHDIISCGIF